MRVKYRFIIDKISMTECLLFIFHESIEEPLVVGYIYKNRYSEVFVSAHFRGHFEAVGASRPVFVLRLGAGFGANS